MQEAVLYSVNNGIATITLNRPESLNSMNGALISGLHKNLSKAADDPAVKVVILTGAGKAFCAGGDLSFLETITENSEKQNFIASVGNVAKRITSIPKPFIAKVNGVAAGAGFNLMLACDLVYVVDTAKFAQSFAKVGLVPDCGGLYFLPKSIGLAKAKELMFTGDLIDAAEADKLGLVNKVYDTASIDEAVEKMATRLANSAPIAISLIKKYINQEPTLDDALLTETVAQPFCMSTEDFKEGVTAFKEKRAPKFHGK